MTQPIAGNQFFTQVHNLAAQLPELDVAELNVVNAVLMSGLTVSTIAGNPNLALTGGTISSVAATTNLVRAGAALTLDGVTVLATGAVTLGAAADRLAFFGTGVQAQLTTAIAAAAFVANGSGIVDDSATFGGYTLGQIAAALQLYGLLT